MHSAHLFIAKLEACAFRIDALIQLIDDYLSNRKERITVNETYSSQKDIFYGVPPGSILDRLLFSIYLCDLFHVFEDFGYYNSYGSLVDQKRLHYCSLDGLMGITKPCIQPAPSTSTQLISTSTHNHFHNILKLFDVLPNFSFTTSETMADYY